MVSLHYCTILLHPSPMIDPFFSVLSGPLLFASCMIFVHFDSLLCFATGFGSLPRAPVRLPNLPSRCLQITLTQWPQFQSLSSPLQLVNCSCRPYDPYRYTLFSVVLSLPLSQTRTHTHTHKMSSTLHDCSLFCYFDASDPPDLSHHSFACRMEEEHTFQSNLTSTPSLTGHNQSF